MKNLYSILSNKGRMGDTELRYVNGELSHVNKQEAYILDNYGQAGENFVIENGSGIIVFPLLSTTFPENENLVASFPSFPSVTR